MTRKILASKTKLQACLSFEEISRRTVVQESSFEGDGTAAAAVGLGLLPIPVMKPETGHFLLMTGEEN